MVWAAVGSAVRVGFVVWGLAEVVLTGDWLVGGAVSVTWPVLTTTTVVGVATGVVVVTRGVVLAVLASGC